MVLLQVYGCHDAPYRMRNVSYYDTGVTDWCIVLRIRYGRYGCYGCRSSDSGAGGLDRECGYWPTRWGIRWRYDSDSGFDGQRCDSGDEMGEATVMAALAIIVR